MSGPAEVADAVVAAIHSGDIAKLRQLLAQHPGLAAELARRGHEVERWPDWIWLAGAVCGILVDKQRGTLEAGADPNARQPGEETPLHWAASSDDRHVAAALVDAGADINAPDGSIGTPLANAVGYACWDVARLLVARGARLCFLRGPEGIIIGLAEQLS